MFYLLCVVVACWRQIDQNFFCTYVRVLEVLFKIKCCGKGSILFFRSVIFHYYVWHGYNKRLLQTSFFFSVFLNEPENIVFSKNRKFKFDFYKWTGWKRVILSQVMWLSWVSEPLWTKFYRLLHIFNMKILKYIFRFW